MAKYFSRANSCVTGIYRGISETKHFDKDNSSMKQMGEWNKQWWAQEIILFRLSSVIMRSVSVRGTLIKIQMIIRDIQLAEIEGKLCSCNYICAIYYSEFFVCRVV